jgi:hypothetical protein
MGWQEYQTALAALQQFPWAVATGDDEKVLRALGKLPPKKRSAGETFINWSALFSHVLTATIVLQISDTFAAYGGDFVCPLNRCMVTCPLSLLKVRAVRR